MDVQPRGFRLPMWSWTEISSRSRFRDLDPPPIDLLGRKLQACRQKESSLSIFLTLDLDL